MAKARWGVEFKDFERLSQQLEKLASKEVLRNTTEKALKETHKIITEKTDEAIKEHKRTGRTEGSIKQDADVNWTSDVGFVDVGFNVKEGGLASIFLMFGTPRMKPDTDLFNAVYGQKNKIDKAQKEIFDNEISKYL